MKSRPAVTVVDSPHACESPTALPTIVLPTIALPTIGYARLVSRLLLCGLGAVAACLASPSDARAQDKTADSKPAETGETEQAETEQAAWKPLFDGKTLKDWEITSFGGEGEVVVKNGVIEMGMGSPLTGITYLGNIPTGDYEVRLRAMRIEVIDFFSTVTFPVDDSFCSLVVGGWAGPVVGISCVDFFDASENETTTYHKLESKKWYRIRIRVRKNRIQAWIDDKEVVDLETTGRKLSTRAEVSLNEPFGIACYQTRAGIRKIELRELPGKSSR
ncbi:MAG: 3-keto-disaccharide hydrolase [Planctomycetota bacterium]